MTFRFLFFLSILYLSSCASDPESGMVATKHPAPQHIDHSGHDHDHSGHHHHDHVEMHEETADKDYGVQFTTPEGWKKAATDIPDSGSYIMIEKQGEDESGQVIVSVVNAKMPLNTYMDVMKKQLFDNLSQADVKFNFSEIKNVTFNGLEALGSTYTHNSGGLNFEGSMKAFHCGEKSVFLFVQQEAADLAKNKPGLDVLLNSFTCSGEQG